MARTRGGNHRVNAGYTLLARLAPECVEQAAALLRDYAEREALPFASSTTTHFASVTVIPAQKYDDEPLPATLMFATSYCGPLRVHVRELIELMQPQLRALLACCQEFEVGCAVADLEAFMIAHRRSDTFYSGMQHLGPTDVTNHQKLRAEIERILDEDPTGEPRAIHARVRDRILATPGFEWVSEPFEPTLEAWWALHWRSVIMLAIAVPFLVLSAVSIVAALATHGDVLGTTAKVCGVVLAGVAAFAGLLLAGVRHAELQQRFVAKRRLDPEVRDLAATQNRAVINETTICGPIKEGVVRPLVMRLALWIIARAAEGIPIVRKAINIPTVATARWIATDGGRRLIFISNYTNAAEPYVRDFIDVKGGAENINLSFGFGRGYPPTRWIMKDGALADPNAFIYVVTQNQYPTLYWYGPYRDLSIDNIKINRKLREGLCTVHDARSAQAWLNLLGGDLGGNREKAEPTPTPEHPQVLETDDIQGLVVRGYGTLEHAKFVLLAVKDGERARAYLRHLVTKINPASVSPESHAFQIAFTAGGLARLGVSDETRATFAREFLEGMSDPVRAASLGDDLEAKLEWTDRLDREATAEKVVDALLVVYAKSETALRTLVDKELDQMRDGFALVEEKSSAMLDGQKEHFGWRDGISMPKIEGVPARAGRQPKTETDDKQTWTPTAIRSGEFVLGYLNEYNCYTESPTAELAEDRYNHLPFARDGALKDLGKNGTYLVFREMTQDPHALWTYLHESSREPGADRMESAIALGSKMVGRWPSGAPIVQSDRDDATLESANEFTYGSDPNGLKCPLGAHIRRANPRDMLAEDRDQDDSVEMVRKHQMVRRGRPFGASASQHVAPAEILEKGADTTRRGLHFICLVGHISRQFEFVQRSWIHAPNFTALFRDGDPITSRRTTGPNANNEFTCPATPVRRKYTGLKPFTTLVGGGYFFLPGLRALRFIAKDPK